LLDRDIGRLRPVQNLVDYLSGASKQFGEIGPIGQHTSGLDAVSEAVHCRKSHCQRPGVDPNAVCSRVVVDLSIENSTFAKLDIERGGAGPGGAST
jgi:hypothetical protein